MKNNSRLLAFPNGTFTLRDLKNGQLGEAMHSSIGPWEEAQRVYIQQINFPESFVNLGNSILVLDIGLGIAANALAAIEGWVDAEKKLKAQQVQTLKIVSFEADLTGIEFALEYCHKFPFIYRNFELIKTLLSDGRVSWTSNFGSKLEWILQQGDFRNQIQKYSNPHLIFYDLYSPKTCDPLWNYDCFKLLYEISMTKHNEKNSTQIITYCSSTAVRAALLLAGFYVGYGVSTTVKKETTVASTDRSALCNPLDEKWLNHWMRSKKPLPSDCLHLDRLEVYQYISNRVLNPAV